MIRTYLERDIPRLGPRIPATALRRFPTMLGHSQGQILNLSRLARSLSVAGTTVARYLDLLEPAPGAPPACALPQCPQAPGEVPEDLRPRLRLAARPPGSSGHGGAARSSCGWRRLGGIRHWERAVGRANESAAWLLPHRRRSGDRPCPGTPEGGTWAVEIKSAASPKLRRGFHNARRDIRPSRTFAVHRGTERYPLADGVEAIGLGDLCREAAA